MPQCPVHSFIWEIYAIFLFSPRFTFFFMIYVYHTYEGCTCPECIFCRKLTLQHACTWVCSHLFPPFLLDCCSSAWILLFVKCFSEKHFLPVGFICIRFDLLHRAFSEGDFTGCEMFLLPSYLIML